MERKVRDYCHGGGKAVTWRKRTPRRTPRKNVAAIAPREGFVDGARFEFQKRIARIDWRTLHTIDVDRVIREVDIDTLESVLDTVAFGDIQGEDTRHFTETNFVKIFRLAQLMVEYLLHVQDLLTDTKSRLLQFRVSMEQKNEKIRSRFLCQRDALLQTRHELKQAKKTLKAYEVMLKVREENNQTSQSKVSQVWQCPSCEKAFESSYYLDMHVARKHQNEQEVMQDKILALVTTAEEVKAEMSFAVQTEFQQLRERYQADLQRAETNSNTQVQTLHEDLRQSNNQLRDVQTRVEVLQAKILSNSPNNSRLGSLQAVEKSNENCQSPNPKRLHDLESKFSGLELQVKTLIQENSRLLKELNVTYAEIEEEPVALSVHEDRQVSSTRERWTDKDEALRVLAHPTTWRRRTKAVPEEPSEGESSPDPENLTHTTSPVKRAQRFHTPEWTRISFTERPKKSAAPKQIKLRGGGDHPTTVEEMRAKLEWEMSAAHEEQKKRQKAVQQLLAKELVRENRKTGKPTRSEDRKSCKAATQYSYTSRSETPSESIVPLLLALPNKLETISPSSTIHTVRKIISNRGESQRFRPILSPLPETRIQPFHSPPPYKSGPCCERPLHPYLRRGIGNPQTRPQPQPSFHLAVLSSNPDLTSVTRSRILNQTVAPSKENIIARLNAVTRELGKYFPAEKPKLKCGTSSGSAQSTIPDIETTETETNETEDDEVEKRTTPPENGDDLSGKLSKELQKFGIASTTNGISDTTYKSMSSALEMQRSVRMSQIHGDERQIVKYERDAVVWHTQMAVRDRDLVIVKSPFNVVTDFDSDHSNASEYSVEESGRSKKSNESGCESRADSRELKTGGASDVRSSEQSSSTSSENSDNIQETEVTYKSKNVNWAKNSKADGSVQLGPRSPSPEGRVQYVSRKYSRDSTLKQANSSRNVRGPPSRGELIRGVADAVDHTRQSEEEEVDEDAFGLGDWDSDEDKGK